MPWGELYTQPYCASEAIKGGAGQIGRTLIAGADTPQQQSVTAALNNWVVTNNPIHPAL